MRSGELGNAGFIIAGGSALGLTIRSFMAGDILLGVIGLAATLGFIIMGRRRARHQQEKEALAAADEYDRLHEKDVPRDTET